MSFVTAVLFLGVLGYIIQRVFHSNKSVRAFFYFVLHCFLKPLGKDIEGGQQGALEKFYQGQKDIYDITRSRLLKGRNTMLALATAEMTIRAPRASKVADKKFVWVDIGGGTGWNIEEMDKIVPVCRTFSAIYLVDLSPSLCQVARERFERLGWEKVVHVVCADAATFEVEGLEEADMVTLSYSLSMIPTYFAVIDRIDKLLSPEGVVGVVDFYVASDTHSQVQHDTGEARHVNWLSRHFWKIWFEFDRVFVDSSRREYLEYRFGTLKSVNGRNRFVVPFLIKIPYYVWLGRRKTSDSRIEAEFDQLAAQSPYLKPKTGINIGTAASMMSKEPALSLESSMMPLHEFYYQRHLWRLPFDAKDPKYAPYQDFIYAFTWEDPREDMNIFNITSDDTMLVITSAGDNALAYAAEKSPRRIHCVDLNPTQNHLLELKLAAFAALKQSDVFALFGEGRHPTFLNLLVTRLSPHLSSHALEFWIQNYRRFNESSPGLYETGYSGLAIRITQWVFWMTGLQPEIKRMCAAKNVAEQEKIYMDKIRPVLLHPLLVKCVFANPVFLWKSLGVPMNQMNMYLQECSTAEYMAATLDPVVRRSLFSDDNYFYNLCLQSHHTTKSCPSYLLPESHAKLSSSRTLDAFRLHTNCLHDVMLALEPASVTKAVLMDHADWFDGNGVELRAELKALSSVIRPGGEVLFRSAAKQPWYITVYEEEGFECERVAVRENGRSIDRVNMYASTWLAKRKFVT